jgi:uncharacterized protein YidB (DUF937 family)
MKTRMNIKLGVVAAAAIAVAGGGVAIAAADPWDPKKVSQAVIDDAAQQLGVEPDELSDALKQALENRVDDALAAGRLTEEQAERLKKAIAANDVPLPLGLFGFKGLERPDLGHIGPFGSLATASDYLGVSETELRSRLENGKSLAQIAKAEGKSVEGLVQALVDDVTDKLDAAVDAGKVTQAEADRIRADWKERITDFVNDTLPLRLHFGFDKDGFGFRDHFELRPDGFGDRGHFGFGPDRFGHEPWSRAGPSA